MVKYLEVLATVSEGALGHLNLGRFAYPVLL